MHDLAELTERFYRDVEGNYLGSFMGVWVRLPDPEPEPVPDPLPEDWVPPPPPDPVYEESWPHIPEGAIQTSTPPQRANQKWNELTEAWDAPQVSPADIDAERDRRITAGFTFHGAFFQSRPEDRENLAGASTAALASIMGGAQPEDLRWNGGDADFTWIAADNSEMPLDAQGMFALGTAAMAHKESHIRAARVLKNMDPIPSDFATNATYWPPTA